MPKHVSVTIDDITASRLEQMKIDPKKVCSSMLRWYLHEYESDAGKLFILEHLREQITAMEIEISTLEHKKVLLKELKRKLVIMEEEYEDSNNKLELHYLISYLNRRIVIYRYNLSEIKTKQSDVIEKIKQLDRTFNLEKHVNKIRLIREDQII